MHGISRSWAPPYALEALRPAAMWQRLALSDRHFVLIGSSHPGAFPEATGAVAKALPVLGAAGFRHIGVPWTRRPLQHLLVSFNQLSLIDLLERKHERWLETAFCMFPNRVVQGEAESRVRCRLADVTLAKAVRRSGVNVVALEQGPDLRDVLDDLPPGQKRRLHLALALDMPQGLAGERERNLFETFRQANLSFDMGRAAALSAASGSSRALVLHDSSHYRGEAGNGIDAYLRSDRLACVMIGEGTGLYQKLALDAPDRCKPDFIVDVSRNTAWAMPPAGDKGLLRPAKEAASSAACGHTWRHLPAPEHP